jgi:hypothetical protein
MYPIDFEVTRSKVKHTGLPMGGRCSLLNLGSKGQKSNTLDIEVKIWFPGSRVTPYMTHMDNPWDVKYQRFYRALCLSIQEIGNLYLLTPLRLWGMGGILVSLAHSISS